MDIKYFISDLLENLKKRFRKTSSEESDWNTDYETSFYQQDYPNGKQDIPTGARPQNPADGELYIPDDEEDEGSRADRLRKKHILTAGGIVAFIAAASMAYTTLVPDTPDASKQQQPQETTVSARAGNKDLPSKYSDIAKYQNNQKPKEKDSKREYSCKIPCGANGKPARCRTAQPCSQRFSYLFGPVRNSCPSAKYFGRTESRPAGSRRSTESRRRSHEQLYRI